MDSKGHETCVYTSKAKCDKVTLEALGKCVEMTADQKTPTQCSKWARSLFDERPICDQHATGLLNRALEAHKAAEKRASLDARLDDYIAWTAAHPSVWDSRHA